MPYFAKETLDKMYSTGYFQDYTPAWHRIRNVDNPKRRFRRAQAALGRPVGRYLEVGAGQGYGLEAALKMGWEVHGQDFSAEFVAQVRQRLGLDLLSGLLNKESFPAGHFDFIYMDSVLEHVADPLAFMDILKGYLAPGGVLYVVMPNENSLPNLLKDAVFRLMGSRRTTRICPFEDSYHLLGFSKASVRFLAAKTGLELVWQSCRGSYMHIEKFRRPQDGLAKYAARRLAGLVYLACDGLDDGLNLEALFRKPAA
jgi:SAM-dependent methyltransferase